MPYRDPGCLLLDLAASACSPRKNPSMPRNRVLPLIALLSLAAFPLGAQTSLSERMQAFLAEVRETPNTGLIPYFPRRGDWTWVQTLEHPRDGRRTGTWRFSGPETPRVVSADGPACLAFGGGTVEGGPFERSFGMQAARYSGPWRRVRGNRFVPPGESARSPVFVEWGREDGQWVVTAFGDENVSAVPGRPAGPFSREAAHVPEDAAFAPADWHMITVEERRYVKYGLPRPLGRVEIRRIGVLHRVSVYVGREAGAERSGFLYLPVSPGQFQPYEGPGSGPCA